MSVDWRSIVECAQGNGLRVTGFTDQHHFLTGIISEFESGDVSQSLLAHSPKAKRELQTLLHPEMLGRAFQVLALAKNVDSGMNPLAGFKFAAESRSSLKLTDSAE
jgi:SAM-dependent MidA family methyltransferase